MQRYPLDEQVQAFLDDAESYYPADNAALDVAENRERYLHLCDAYQAPVPQDIDKEDSSVSGRHGKIPVRQYLVRGVDTHKRVLYFHGGGFTVGNLDSHDSICAEIAHRTRIPVTAVDYHLAPEHVFPVQVHDAIDAFSQLDLGGTVVAGDSAGATLCASLCIARQHSKSSPIGQVLIYPSLGGQCLNLDSYHSNFDAPGLTTADVDSYKSKWAGGELPWQDPLFAPLSLDDFSGLPPCYAFAAEHDPLRDDAITYVDRLHTAGIRAEAVVEPGLVHAYLRARHVSDKAGSSFDRICEAIVTLHNELE